MEMVTAAMFVFREERGGELVGPTHGRGGKRKTLRMRMKTARRSPVRRRTVRKRTTAMRTTRLSEAARGGTGTERDEARTLRRPRTTTYLPTTTPANTAVFQITLSWWVPSEAYFLISLVCSHVKRFI